MMTSNRRPFLALALATSTARTQSAYLVGTAFAGHWLRLSPTLLSVTVLVWLSSVTPLHAQSTSEVTQVWGAVGLGAGQSAGPYQGGGELAGLAELVVQPGTHRFSIRAAFVTDISTFEVGEVGVLYGHAWRGERNQRSISAGVARVSSYKAPGCNSRDFVCHTIGLPLSAEIAWRRLGLQGFGNINSVSSFAAVALTFRIGRVR